MRFIMIRHPETIGNREKRYIGTTESQYTSKGKMQARRIVRSIREYDFDIIYTSPSCRTKDLARIIAKKYDKDMVVKKSITEMNFGIFENRNYIYIREKFLDEWDNWNKDILNYRIPYGESLMDVYDRVTKFIDLIKGKTGSCLLVTHGGIIQTIIPYLIGLDIEDRWHFKILPASISIVDYENDYGVLTKL